MVLVVGSPFILQHITSVRYEYRRVELWTPEKEQELARKGIRVKPASENTLEKIYEETVKNTPDDYEMLRGPRPWEDNSDYHKKIEELEEKNKHKQLKHKKAKEEMYKMQGIQKKDRNTEERR